MTRSTPQTHRGGEKEEQVGGKGGKNWVDEEGGRRPGASRGLRQGAKQTGKRWLLVLLN